MPIDNCTHTFEQISSIDLPAYFQRLQASLEQPIPAENFKGFKSVTRELLSRIYPLCEFSGCYVFIDGSKPIYVGISRNVIKRLVQHLNHDSHYSASLVYRMASDEFPHEMKRDQAMKDDQFRQVFFGRQEYLRKMKVAYVEIQNDLELYLFEVFAAMKLDTDTWNTFRTH